MSTEVEPKDSARPASLSKGLAATSAALIAANQPAFGDSPIGAATILNLIGSYFGPLIPNDEIRYRRVVADSQYFGVAIDFVRNSIITDPILSPAAPASSPYKPDVFDCDDYVQYLRTKMALYALQNGFACPIALGFILTDEHAFNFFVDPSVQLHLINTQSDDRAVTSDIDQFGDALGIGDGNTIQAIYI